MHSHAVGIVFIVKSENMFTVRRETQPHPRWRGLDPRQSVGV